MFENEIADDKVYHDIESKGYAEFSFLSEGKAENCNYYPKN